MLNKWQSFIFGRKKVIRKKNENTSNFFLSFLDSHFLWFWEFNAMCMDGIAKQTKRNVESASRRENVFGRSQIAWCVQMLFWWNSYIHLWTASTLTPAVSDDLLLVYALLCGCSIRFALHRNIVNRCRHGIYIIKQFATCTSSEFRTKSLFSL